MIAVAILCLVPSAIVLASTASLIAVLPALSPPPSFPTAAVTTAALTTAFVAASTSAAALIIAFAPLNTVG